MKKLFIAASLIIGMMAGAMVLSSFSEPKEDVNKDCTGICVKDDGWRRVGEYTGKSSDGAIKKFIIWEKDNMCNAYHWVLAISPVSYCHIKTDPDNTDPRYTGALRQNRDDYWYAAYDGTNYFIDF